MIYIRVAKIKNSYMYKTDKNDKGTHNYLVYFNKKTRRYNAVQLTHLYVKDKERFKQVRKGNILLEKFKEYDVPSGVKNHIYTTNIYGAAINLNDSKNVVEVGNRYLSKNQSKRILDFVNKKKKT